MNKNTKQILFEEDQHFRQPLLWFILIGVSGLFTYGVITQIFLGISLGSKPVPDLVLVLLWLIFGLGLPYGFWKATLTTRVYSDGINISFYPMKLSEEFYSYNQIDKIEQVTYTPILHYGGWGIRYGIKGKAYNIHGKHGIKIWFKSGKPILIGSQRSDELYSILQKQVE